jgi:hypothetical protein
LTKWPTLGGPITFWKLYGKTFFPKIQNGGQKYKYTIYVTFSLLSLAAIFNFSKYLGFSKLPTNFYFLFGSLVIGLCTKKSTLETTAKRLFCTIQNWTTD